MDLAEQVFAAVDAFVDVRTKAAAEAVTALALRLDAVEKRPPADDMQKFVAAMTAKLLA